MLAIIIWSGELLHKEKLQNETVREQKKKINLISLFESLVQQHVSRGEMLTREQESTGKASRAPAGREAEGRAGLSAALAPLAPGSPVS